MGILPCHTRSLHTNVVDSIASFMTTWLSLVASLVVTHHEWQGIRLLDFFSLQAKAVKPRCQQPSLQRSNRAALPPFLLSSNRAVLPPFLLSSNRAALPPFLLSSNSSFLIFSRRRQDSRDHNIQLLNLTHHNKKFLPVDQF